MTSPLTARELRRIGIQQWEDIAEDNHGADILLGNGFSISLHRKFAYPSLFDQFIGTCKPSTREVFLRFATSNFEEILGEFASAQRVATALGEDPSRIVRATEFVRNGLIKVVEEVHPRKDALPWPMMESYARTFDSFGDIFTTNYDALLYHIIMLRKDWWTETGKGHPYNDYFWEVYDAEWLRHKDFQNLSYYKHVYYVHGALFLFQGGADNLKIRSSDTELIETISQKIRAGRIPIFVSEGRSDLKRLALARNRYLGFAYDHLKKPRKRIVTFGFSFSSQDQHIIDALMPTTLIDASVYVGERSAAELQAEVDRLKVVLGKSRVRFYQAESLFRAA